MEKTTWVPAQESRQFDLYPPRQVSWRYPEDSDPNTQIDDPLQTLGRVRFLILPKTYRMYSLEFPPVRPTLRSDDSKLPVLLKHLCVEIRKANFSGVGTLNAPGRFAYGASCVK